MSENLKQKKQTNGVEHTAMFDNLVDIVDLEGNPVFLVKENEELLTNTKIVIGGREYTPPPRDQMPWLLCRAENVIKYYEEAALLPELETNKQLYEEIRDYFTDVSDLPEDCFYDLITLWVFHTYLLELFNYSPILCFYAVPERGKTRTGKGIIYITYRGVHIESLRESSLFRMAENFRASLFFDVMNLWKKAEKAGSEDILLLRIEKGPKVSRVIHPERGKFKDTVFYNVFGPTIIGTNEPLHHILDTRALQITMQETNKLFEKEIREENSLPLKEKLLAFRARYLNKTISLVTEKPTKGRLGDIMMPLLQTIRIVNPKREPIFYEILNTVKENKMLQKSEEFEAQVLRIIVSFGGRIQNGVLPIKKITEAINEDKIDRYKISPHRIGHVTTAMGFSKGKMGDGASAIIWDDNLINKLRISYGISDTSVSSEKEGK